MAMSSMSNLYGFQQLASPLTYAATQQSVMPSTSTVTSVPASVKAEPSASDSAKDNYYEMYSAETNNDTEACSSIRSNASPESQNELLLGPYPGDQYDIADQERKKLERKRARNRMAATKCRQRKIQKISELEKLVREETATANRKVQDLKALEANVEQLRQILHEHRSRGCQLPATTK